MQECKKSRNSNGNGNGNGNGNTSVMLPRYFTSWVVEQVGGGFVLIGLPEGGPSFEVLLQL